MNRATIAPETAPFKGNKTLRWDESAGLEHHCGICATVLHNARAKTSCIGKHVEPCHRFHQQFHFVGKSHECFGCNSSDELHHTRHKEILVIIREIEVLDEPGSSLPQGKLPNGKPHRVSSTTDPTSLNPLTDTSSESARVNRTRVTRRERKKAKKAGNGNPRDRKSIEAFPKEEIDFVSEAIHLNVHESKGAWHGSYAYQHHTKSVVEESTLTHEDNEGDKEIAPVARFESLAVKTPGTAVKVRHKPLKELTPRQRKTVLKLTSGKHSHKTGDSRKFATQFTAEREDLFSGLDPKIFSRLGVEVDPPISSRARKDLITKLIDAVKKDIDIIEAEDSETSKRAEAFKNWAGKAAFAIIMETRNHLDWATGQKITVPIFEEFEDDKLDPEGIDEAKNAENQDPIPSLAPQVKDNWKPKVKTPLASKNFDNEDEGGFMAASHRRLRIKKSQGAKKKFIKLSVNYNLAETALDIDEEGEDIQEEEEAEDIYEMIRRYEQLQAGERNLGGAYTESTPDCRTRLGYTLG